MLPQITLRASNNINLSIFTPLLSTRAAGLCLVRRIIVLRVAKNPQDDTPAAAAAALTDMPIVSLFGLRHAGRLRRHKNSHIPGRCASTITLSRLRASTFGLVSGVVSGLRVDFGGTALQEVVTVNGMLIPVTATSLSAPSCSAAEGVIEDGAMDDRADIPAARDGTALPGRRRASTSVWDAAVVREQSFDFGGAAPQKFVAVNGPSIQVLTSNLSALNRSVAEDVIKSGPVDDSADFLGRRARTTLADGLCASTSGLDSEMATGPSCAFGGTALQTVVTVNGLSSPVTTSNLSELSGSVAECVTYGGAVDDSADILAVCHGTTPLGGFVRPRLAWIQGW